MENETISTASMQDNNAAGAESSGKLFTQDEVNRIVSERLKRAKKSESVQDDSTPITAEPAAQDGTETADNAESDDAQHISIDEREKAVKERESLLECKEYMDSENIPKDIQETLLKLFPTSDVKYFTDSARIINYMILKGRPAIKTVGAKVATPPQRMDKSVDEQIRDAFKGGNIRKQNRSEYF